MTIDWWTIGLQTINVAVLVWLLRRFFWGPVAAMIDQRRAATLLTLSEADAKLKRAAAALVEIDRTRAGFALEGEAIRTAARASADQDRTASLAKAASDTAAREAVARAAIETERSAADAACADRASHLAVDIARHLAARLNGPAVQAAFLDWLIAAIRAMPEAARQAAGADGAALEAVSASPLAAVDQDRYRKKISQAFESGPSITFTTDPALIAGLELRGPTLLVGNSWRADLIRIRADLTHDDRR